MARGQMPGRSAQHDGWRTPESDSGGCPASRELSVSAVSTIASMPIGTGHRRIQGKQKCMRCDAYWVGVDGPLTSIAFGALQEAVCHILRVCTLSTAPAPMC